MAIFDKHYRPRLVDKRIKLYLSTFGALCIEGPKWCGKTMSALQVAGSSVMLEGSPIDRQLAEMSPDTVLSGDYPRLIDEWQEVPSLWDAVRFKVDTFSEKGLFILTGSTGVSPDKVRHSGAGRIARLKMNTMSLFESGESSGLVSLRKLFEGEFSSVSSPAPSLEDLAYYIVRGGWPGGLDIPPENAGLPASEYLSATLSSDIYKLDEVKRSPEKFRLLLRSIARNESTTASLKKIASDIALDGNSALHFTTLEDYLEVLKRLFLIENQKPFGQGVRSSVRVKQMEKWHFMDPSLAASLLGVTVSSLLRDLETFGFLFESLVERDLRIYAETEGARLFHYQDYKNRELDAVVEWNDGRWAGFEIKLGFNQVDAAAENLLKLQKEIEADPKGRKPEFLAVICGLVSGAYRRPDGVYVLPLTTLKN